MLLSPLVYGALFCGSLAVAVGFAVWGLVLRMRARRAVPTLPVAAVASLAARLRRAAPHGLLALGMAGALVESWWLRQHAARVVVISDAFDRPEAWRGIYIGAAEHHRPAGYRKDCGPDPTWILNDSTSAVSLRVLDRGDVVGLAPERIAPGERACADAIDYLGPRQHPSARLRLRPRVGDPDGPEVLRVWLTWEETGISAVDPHDATPDLRAARILWRGVLSGRAQFGRERLLSGQPRDATRGGAPAAAVLAREANAPAVRAEARGALHEHVPPRPLWLDGVLHRTRREQMAACL